MKDIDTKEYTLTFEYGEDGGSSYYKRPVIKHLPFNAKVNLMQSLMRDVLTEKELHHIDFRFL